MRKIAVLSLSALLLTSCSLTPEYERPDVETPAGWSKTAKSDVQKQEKSPVIASDWWSSFGSHELDAFMHRALEHNTDLRAGLQRIEQSRASLRIAGSNLIPSIGASAGASRSRTNPASGETKGSTSLSAGMNASYELDLFGANMAGADAARARLSGSVFGQEALKLTIMSDVATGYFTLLNLRERLQIADDNLANAREVLRIVTARAEAGAESDLILAQQTGAVATNEAARASLVEQVMNAENALAVLLGKPPQTLAVTQTDLEGLTIPEIAMGQPSDLLYRRPDLRAVEASLLAANADIGAARAAFFPSLSLGLSNSVAMAGFGDPSTTVLSLAAAISAPIFQGGRLQGGLEYANARQLELVETYRGTVLTAFQDVENALAALRSSQERERALAVSMQQARRAYALSKNRYDAGAIDFQTLLDTQNTQLSAEDSYARARLDRLTASVNLYRALGGGWQS